MTKEPPQILSPVSSDLLIAAEILRNGGLVAFPTETVYGLGGDASNDHAIAAIFDAKGRPSFNPLIVHFPDAEAVWRHVDLDPSARRVAHKLAAAFWPGPLTMVLKRRAGSPLSLLVSAGLDTIAVRVPSHAVAHNLLVATARPIAAPSANRSGSISPTQASHVLDSLGNRVDAIVDGGACDIGIESSVVAVEDKRTTLLRPGSITRQDIESLIGPIDVSDDDDAPATPRSPGMLKRHYAPDTRTRLNAAHADAGELLLGFGPKALTDAPHGSLNLSETGDLREAAANLFAMLRRLDKLGAEGIAVMPIPEIGLGVAINDRLKRASVPEHQ